MALKFACMLLLASTSIVSTVSAEDPGIFVQALGTKILTVPFTDRINQLLSDRAIFGRQIRIRASDDCIDSDWATDKNDFSPKPASCNQNKFSQSVRVHNKVWTIGQQLAEHGGTWPCLACTSFAEDCLVEFVPCTLDRNMRFFIRVHAPQIDLGDDRVYFSIHSTLYPKKCLTSLFSTKKNGNTFFLDECYGNEKQSFYLDMDWTEDLTKVRKQIESEKLYFK